MMGTERKPGSEEVQDRKPTFEEGDENVGLSDAVVKGLREDWEALDEDIPTPSVKKPRSERDPYEEIPYTERRLRTKRKILASLRPYERNEREEIEKEIAVLVADLQFYEGKKKRLDEEKEFEDDPSKRS